MKVFSLTVFVLFLIAVPLAASSLTDDFMHGNPEITSIGSLAFGPEGILFLGDSRSGAIFAIDTADKTPSVNKDGLEVENIDEKIASMLGTTVKDIAINDMAVNPISQNAYFSISRGSGNDGVDLLLRVTPEGKIEEVPLQNIQYSKKPLTKIVAEDAKDRRGRSLRSQAITDLVYYDGQLFIAGLSNEEFSSALRVTPFPFEDKEQSSSLEIYHAAHRQFETHAPIRTFLAYDLKDVSHVLAAYTCTPLVTFPMSKVKDGGHVKGRTVAELGSGNRPLDMLVYEQDNKEYILLANSNRTLMKIDPQDIEKQEAITEPVTERFGTAGAGYIAVNQVGVQEMDDFNSDHVLVVQRMANGSLNLHSLPKRRL